MTNQTQNTQKETIKKETPKKTTPKTEQPQLKEITIKIGYISSGKPHIISFYDRKGGKQLETSPFNTRLSTEDDYYNYSYHWDLREGKDLEKLQKNYPELKSYDQLIKEEGFKNLKNTKSGYGLWTLSTIYKLIRDGRMNIKNDKIHLKIEWNGTEEETQLLENPNLKFDTPKKSNGKKKTKEDMELLDGLSFFE